MSPEGQFDFLDNISVTEEQAENSDFGGDSDAEDDKMYGETSSSRPSRGSLEPSTSFAMDWDSDDFIADPDYEIDDTPLKRMPLFPDISSSEDESMGFTPSKQTFGSKFANQSTDDYVWTKTATQTKTYRNFVYEETSKANFSVDFTSPIEIFNHFFSDCKNILLIESERYAGQRGATLNMADKELDAFLGILVLTGFHHLPGIRMYWSTDPNLNVPRISKIMSIRRFLHILRFLHVNNNENMPKRGENEYDKLYKIRPLIKILTEKYTTSFTINRNASIDESMVGFKGRTSLKQYMPLKPTKRGFKIWALNCSETGYLYNFIVYEGKSISKEEGTLGEKTILELSKPLRNTGRCLYFDNFFSTIPLMSNLLSVGLFACGTFRTNRKFYPKNMFTEDKKFKMGDSDFAQSNEISVVKWKDRGSKPVVIVSNFHNPASASQVMRTNKTGEKESVNCPEAIRDYNKFMGGVDHFDQLIECYNISKKSRRWWVKLLYYFIDTAIVNSYIIFCHERKKLNQKIVPQLEFRSILANQLIADYQGVRKRGPQKVTKTKLSKVDSNRNITVSNTLRLGNVGSHLPSKGTYRRCAFCSTKQKVKRSNILCKECDVVLCLGCYEPFHRK